MSSRACSGSDSPPACRISLIRSDLLNMEPSSAGSEAVEYIRRPACVHDFRAFCASRADSSMSRPRKEHRAAMTALIQNRHYRQPLIALIALIALTSCGTDAAPTEPTGSERSPGVSLNSTVGVPTCGFENGEA